ncbi:SUN domain-containing protein 1-like [Actinidia eriantha]|uniref:SUN domain-containing protein 1-like n=1 Tax=Actinidia eriantha TaxID=165200 RepID=UPI00258B0D7B|nr:SUN domain-containing protein 1-like [Actinidia eriantha]
MSTSTVSITANPAAATRRRPVVVGDKKPGIELVSVDGDKLSADKDLSHSIRGEMAILEREISREAIHVKKTLPASAATTLPPRRTNRKGVSKPEKPRWQVVISVFTKNFLLLLVLLGLVQMIRRLATSSDNNNSAIASSSSSSARVSEMDRRMGEMEKALKTTTKAMREIGGLREELSEKIEGRSVELGNGLKKVVARTEILEKSLAELRAKELVSKEDLEILFDEFNKGKGLDHGYGDMDLGEIKIGGLREELSEKIEGRSVELGNGLKKLEGRTEILEKSLAELREKELVSKEDLEILFDEFNKGKGLDHGYGDMDLGEIRVFAREIVEKEIEKYAADGLGRVDYALASGGAMVVKHSEPYTTARGNNWFYATKLKEVHDDAEKMLRPSFGEPGQCFPLRGSNGFVEIKLRTAIVPEAVTLEHVAKSVAYDRSSAPKHCRVSGWLQGHLPTVQVVDTEKMFLLTEFAYDLEKSNTQTFNVLDSAGSGTIDMVRFDFTSNHGSPSHTCIYRLRVHGREPNSVSLLAA